MSEDALAYNNLKHWYAIYVNARHEKKVAAKLIEQGVESYLPIAKKLQQWSDRKKWIEFPMLSGYVFVNILLDIEKDTILQQPSVFGFVKFESKEAVVNSQDIEILKSIELTGYDITHESEKFNLFDNVIITQGPLKGLKGILVNVKDEEYVSIQLDSIQQNIKVRLPKHILQHN